MTRTATLKSAAGLSLHPPIEALGSGWILDDMLTADEWEFATRAEAEAFATAHYGVTEWAAPDFAEDFFFPAKTARALEAELASILAED